MRHEEGSKKLYAHIGVTFDMLCRSMELERIVSSTATDYTAKSASIKCKDNSDFHQKVSVNDINNRENLARLPF